MRLRFKEDIDLVKERMLCFWEHKMADRALISVIAPKAPGLHIDMFHNEKDLTCDPEALRRYWEDPETIYRNNIKRLENTYLGGETLPLIFQNYGTSGHCNYFGAVPKYGNDTIWFDPVWEDLSRADSAYTEERLKKHLEIAKYLTDRAGEDYLVGMPDSTGTIDALGHLYGPENVLTDMLDAPEKVKHAIQKVNEGWIKTNELFYKISREHNEGGVHAWMHLYAPGRLTHMQCDTSVMFSKAMYEEFVLDELYQQMDWLEYPVYHFDGIEQTRHLDLLLSLTRLKAIQWTHVAGQPSAKHYMPTLQKIQKAGKSLIIMTPAEDIPELLASLSAKGLYLHTEVATVEEAKALVAYTEENSHA